MKKFYVAAAATALLGTSAAFAQVVVRVAPPPPIVEHRAMPPGRAYVWTDGYQRWNGHGYLSVHGRSVMPPRPAVSGSPDIGHLAVADMSGSPGTGGIKHRVVSERPRFPYLGLFHFWPLIMARLHSQSVTFCLLAYIAESANRLS